MSSTLEEAIEEIYERQEGSDTVMDYHVRHDINSLGILTIYDEESAQSAVSMFAAKIRGKVVVEVGAGIGLLAMEMAKYAKHVYAIEADPAWTYVHVEHLYRRKPTNLTFVFGRAQDMVGLIRADVAVIFTRSDVEGMTALAKQFAPFVVHG